jgi:hypothetical protein
MVAIQGGHPPFKGDSPHLHPQPTRTKSSPTRSKVLPLRHGGWVCNTHFVIARNNTNRENNFSLCEFNLYASFHVNTIFKNKKN